MLVSTNLIKNPSVDRLLKLWAERYIPDSTTLSSRISKCTVSELTEADSPRGRTQTIAKLSRMVEINCKCAGIQTSVLFSYIPNVVNLTESQGIARTAGLVYEQALSVYQEPSPSAAALVAMPQVGVVDFSNEVYRSMIRLEPNQVERLATALEPVIQQFQQQHLSSIDQRALGFMSTQFHLSSKLVLNRLTVPEQLLLSPYFKFVEEQVCIPWQRICAAAAGHAVDSPNLTIVEQMLPASQEIAQRVFRRASRSNLTHRSQRGRLSDPMVRASALRDIEMFQAYLWLCVLEGSMAAVEQELLPLCTLVFPAINVSWKLVEQMTKLLMDEVSRRLLPHQKHFVQPYTTAMQELFSKVETKVVSSDRLFSLSEKKR